MKPFVKGQAEISNAFLDYIRRGEIAHIWIEGNQLMVHFQWIAVLSSADGLWHREKDLRYIVDLRKVTAEKHTNGRITIAPTIPIGDMWTLALPGDLFLHNSDVV